MSEKHFWSMKYLGIARPDRPTCLPAALDAALKNKIVPEELYLEIEKRVKEAMETGTNNSRTAREGIGYLFSEVFGTSSPKNWKAVSVTTPEQLRKELKRAKEGNRPVLGFVEKLHVAAIKPDSDQKGEAYSLLSTDMAMDGLSLDEVFNLLIHQRDKKGRRFPNLLICPSEPRRKE